MRAKNATIDCGRATRVVAGSVDGKDVRMPPLSEMKTDLLGIGHILKTTLVSVPKYQRSYAWTAKNVNDLLLDLSDAMKSQEDEYFLGSIVAVGTDSGGFDVVDGQQRLASTSIFLS